MKKAELERVVGLCIPHLQKAGLIASELDEQQQEWVNALVALYQDRLRYAAEITDVTQTFFQENVGDEEEAAAVLAEEQVPAVLQAFLAKVEEADEGAFDADAIKDMIKAVQKETGFKGKQLFMPIRAAVTGQTHGPDLNQSIMLLGKAKVAERLNGRLAK